MQYVSGVYFISVKSNYETHLNYSVQSIGQSINESIEIELP